MKLTTSSFVDHRTLIAADLSPEAAGAMQLVAPGLCTSCLGCSTSSCCSCGAAAFGSQPEEIERAERA